MGSINKKRANSAATKLETSLTKSKLSRAEFARRMGYSTRTLYNHLHGRTSEVTVAQSLKKAITVAFNATHSVSQALAREHSMAQTQAHRDAVRAAKKDHSPLLLGANTAYPHLYTGKKAGEIRAAHLKQQWNHLKTGTKPWRLEDMYYNPKDIVQKMLKQHSQKNIKNVRRSKLEGFRRNAYAHIRASNLTPGEIARTDEKLDQLSLLDLEKLLYKAIDMGWDIITSPIDPDTGLPAMPNVDPLLAYLGVEKDNVTFRVR